MLLPNAAARRSWEEPQGERSGKEHSGRKALLQPAPGHREAVSCFEDEGRALPQKASRSCQCVETAAKGEAAPTMYLWAEREFAVEPQREPAGGQGICTCGREAGGGGRVSCPTRGAAGDPPHPPGPSCLSKGT